jgi:hypothetical protein
MLVLRGGQLRESSATGIHRCNPRRKHMTTIFTADPTNPNWPSKVPNAPSGGGRGNNPPKGK